MKLKVFACLLFIALNLTCINRASDMVTFTLTITNIETTSGHLSIGIYDDPNFWLTNSPFAKQWVPVTSTPNKTLTFTVPEGFYSIGIYHDKNSNKKLDSYFFGMPKEPYALSNIDGPLYCSPKFEDSLINISPSANSLILSLR